MERFNETECLESHKDWMASQGHREFMEADVVFIHCKWISQRVGVKLHRQGEGGVTKEKLVGILPLWLDVILPFSGGADKERTSQLISVKSKQQDTCAQGQQPLSQTQLGQTPPPQSSVSLSIDRADKVHSWKGQTGMLLDMFKAIIKMLDGMCLEVHSGFQGVNSPRRCFVCFTTTLLWGLDKHCH